MALDTEFPSWLTPPTQMQQQDMAMRQQANAVDIAAARQKLQEQVQQAAMRRQGMAQYQQKLQQYLQDPQFAGDPEKARIRAYTETAHLLSPDWYKQIAPQDRNEIMRLKNESDAAVKSANLNLLMQKTQSAVDMLQMRLDAQKEIAGLKADAAKNKLSPAAQEAKDYADLKDQLQTETNKVLESGVGEETPELRAQNQKIQNIKNQIESMEARRGETETQITSTPGGATTVTLTKGKVKSPETLTTSEQTRLGEDLIASSNSLRSLSQLKGQLTGNVVGALPTAANIIFDKLLAQVDPSFEDPERVKGRRMINITTQQVLGELNRSGRFSNLELKRIESILPSSGAFGSAAEARDAVDQLKLVLAEKGAKSATAMGRKVPPEVLSALADVPDQQLAADVKAGLLDLNIAIQARAFRKSKGQ